MKFGLYSSRKMENWLKPADSPVTRQKIYWNRSQIAILSTEWKNQLIFSKNWLTFTQQNCKLYIDFVPLHINQAKSSDAKAPSRLTNSFRISTLIYSTKSWVRENRRNLCPIEDRHTCKETTEKEKAENRSAFCAQNFLSKLVMFILHELYVRDYGNALRFVF